MVFYPILIGEMAKREIAKKDVAKRIGVCDKAFSNKLCGKTPFTWPEVCKIRKDFFPDLSPDELFATAAEVAATQSSARKNPASLL